MKKMRVVTLALVLALAAGLTGCGKPGYAGAPGCGECAQDCCVRARLLAEAMDSVGVCSPEEAVDVWMRGLAARSAAMQYAVMDAPLRAQYAAALEQTAPNWVTGVSSPWVGGYDVFDVSEAGDGLRLYSLHVTTETSTGPAGTYLAVLALQKNGGYWQIGGLCADDELRAYTGFLE